jgi:hypothetical protein
MSENGRQRSGLARVMTNGDLVYADDYVPQSILLTGGAGFIGSHVAILLAKKYPSYKVSRWKLYVFLGPTISSNSFWMGTLFSGSR